MPHAALQKQDQKSSFQVKPRQIEMESRASRRPQSPEVTHHRNIGNWRAQIRLFDGPLGKVKLRQRRQGRPNTGFVPGKDTHATRLNKPTSIEKHTNRVEEDMRYDLWALPDVRVSPIRYGTVSKNKSQTIIKLSGTEDVQNLENHSTIQRTPIDKKRNLLDLQYFIDERTRRAEEVSDKEMLFQFENQKSLDSYIETGDKNLIISTEVSKEGLMALEQFKDKNRKKIMGNQKAFNDPIKSVLVSKEKNVKHNTILQKLGLDNITNTIKTLTKDLKDKKWEKLSEVGGILLSIAEIAVPVIGVFLSAPATLTLSVAILIYDLIKAGGEFITVLRSQDQTGAEKVKGILLIAARTLGQTIMTLAGWQAIGELAKLVVVLGGLIKASALAVQGSEKLGKLNKQQDELQEAIDLMRE